MKLGDQLTNDELLTVDCTVLIPAAVAEQITINNADKIRCKILTEGANGPTTLDADHILAERGYLRFRIFWPTPAESSSHISNGYRMLNDFFWKEHDIRDRLEEIIASAFHRTLDFAQAKKTTMRMAALMNGIDQVAKAHLARGLYP